MHLRLARMRWIEAKKPMWVHRAIADLLLRAGAVANRLVYRQSYTPLMAACSKGRVGVVRLLLRHVDGQGLEEEGWKGFRALQLAVSSGNEKVGHRMVVSVPCC